MIPLAAGEAGEAIGRGPLVRPVPGVSIDSRSLRPDELFVALRGERFDGHDFVADAFRAGAGGAVVERSWWEAEGQALASGGTIDGPLVYPVTDTLLALGGLARAVRRRSGAVVIAITGSVGKTGTKDLLALMASRAGKVVKTRANENNEIGVPLTLLSLEADTAVAVIEMGMRGRGQIAALTAVAEPDVGVITNINPVHLELLGTMEGIAAAKAELLVGLGAAAKAVVPGTCGLLEPYLGSVAERVVRFGLERDRDCAEVWAEHSPISGTGGAEVLVHWPEGTATVRTPFASEAKLQNMTAAAAACWAAGMPMAICLEGLEDATITGSRGDMERVGEWLVIDDTYNASPAAVRAALDELMRVARETGRRPVAVLGDMLELGPHSEEFHREIGTYAGEAGVAVLWGVGLLSAATVSAFKESAIGRPTGHLADTAGVGRVMDVLEPGDVILFKASRSLKLEVMVDALRASAEARSSSVGSGMGIGEHGGASPGEGAGR